MSKRKRMYEEFDVQESDDPVVDKLMKRAGQLYNISGLVFQGNETTFVAMFPNSFYIENELDEQHLPVLMIDYFIDELTVAELQAILKRTDDPLIFQEDETGVLKAIVRKSQRVISGAVQQQIWHRDGFQCMLCGRSIPDVQLTVDHFIPLEKEGQFGISDLNHPGNYLSMCRGCNKKKGNQDPLDYCQKHNLDYTGLTLYLSGKAPKSFIGHLS